MKRRSFLKSLAALFAAPTAALTIPMNSDGENIPFSMLPDHIKCSKCKGKAIIDSIYCCPVHLPDPSINASRIRIGFTCTRCTERSLYRVGFKHLSYFDGPGPDIRKRIRAQRNS